MNYLPQREVCSARFLHAGLASNPLGTPLPIQCLTPECSPNSVDLVDIIRPPKNEFALGIISIDCLCCEIKVLLLIPVLCRGPFWLSSQLHRLGRLQR